MRKAILATILIVCAAGAAFAQEEGAPPPGRRGGPVGPPNPFAGNLAAIEQGAVSYNTNCAACHGTYGAGTQTGTELASGMRADLADQDSVIFKRIKGGAPGTLMPAWGGKLSDDDIWKIAAYIRGMRGFAVNAPVPGDVTHGHDVFYGKGQCSSCHMISGKGGISGPELSGIADIRKVSSLVAALTKPMHHVYGGGGAHLGTLVGMTNYLQVRVVQKNGKIVTGALMDESLDSLQILGSDNELHLLDRATVRSETVESKSAMPTDYDKKLTPVEFTDLLAFLSRQSTKPKPVAAAAR